MTLWEHREACRSLRAAGRRTVDEHAIFEAVAEQRRIVAEARKLTRAERRAATRTGLALEGPVDADERSEVSPYGAVGRQRRSRRPRTDAGRGGEQRRGVLVMAEKDRYPHLPADVRPIANLGDEERIAHIRAERWIPHAAAERVLGYLQEAFDQPPRKRRENVLLLGESGMGKSMLLEKFERANALVFDEAAGIQRRPVLIVPTPPSPTEPEFLECVLEAVDAPSAGHWVQGLRLRASTIRLLRDLGVRVLVIDEINSVLVGTPRQQRLFLQLLRFLSNGLGMALVCAGVPEARHALLSDPQLRSRFSDVELPSWAPGTSCATSSTA